MIPESFPVPPAVQDRLAAMEALADEQAALTDRRVAAELIFMRELKAEIDAAALDPRTVQEAYLAARAVASDGFFRRWNDMMPVRIQGAATRAMHRARQAAREVPNGTGGHYWFGTAFLGPTDPAPLEGTPVVYVLYDVANEPIYVGSTRDFLNRLAAHLRDGKPVARWMAYPCRDREAAYELEEKLLAEYKLPLNMRVTR